MDTVRAVQVARSLPGADRCRTVLAGFSFSGGLAVMAAPWIPDLGYIAVGVPTFGAYDLRRTLVKGGSGADSTGSWTVGRRGGESAPGAAALF